MEPPVGAVPARKGLLPDWNLREASINLNPKEAATDWNPKEAPTDWNPKARKGKNMARARRQWQGYRQAHSMPSNRLS